MITARICRKGIEKFRRVAHCSLISLLLTGVGGCTLMNPHLTWERPQETQDDPKPLDVPTSLPRAIAYAHRGIDTYRQAIGDQSLLTNTLAVSLTTLAGAALGVGVQSSSRSAEDFLVSAGIVGASGLALGTWLSSAPRQKAWISGIKALNCAVTAVEPLNINQVNLDGSLKRLSNAIESVGTQMAEVNVETRNVVAVKGQETALAVSARAQVKTAAGQSASAEDTYGAGVKLQLAISQAGPTLENAVDRIAALVDTAILDTETQLSALPDVISGLASASAQFVQLPEAGIFPQVSLSDASQSDNQGLMNGNLVQAEDMLRGNLKKLITAVAEMQTAASHVSAIVKGVNSSMSFEALKACGVTIEAPVMDLKIQPVGVIQFSQGKSGNRGFTISGGKSPYAAQLLDEVDGLTVRQPVAFGPVVKVAATDKVPAETYNIQVSDVAGHRLIVPIEVVPAAK